MKSPTDGNFSICLDQYFFEEPISGNSTDEGDSDVSPDFTLISKRFGSLPDNNLVRPDP